MVIVSPYAKAGYTDSDDATLVSMLAYTESVFGLTPLNSSDANAYDSSNAFDYGQAPVRMTTEQIAASETRAIGAHPGNPDDPS